MAKKIDNTNASRGAIMLAAGILVLIFPDIIRFVIGIALIVLGILALTKK